MFNYTTCLAAFFTLLVLSETAAISSQKHRIQGSWMEKYQKRAIAMGVSAAGNATNTTSNTTANSTALMPKAVFFMTNAANNSIVALPVGANGTLGAGSLTSTGGAGGAEVDPKTGLPTIPDALASQGAVRVAGNMVFAVNAGSNTLSMLAIDPVDPTKLTMVGRPVNTCGDFPVTLAVSIKLQTVCVGNTGARAGVTCAKFNAQTGLGAMDALRPFALGQSNPPKGPLNTVADTFFNIDETALLTTVKGDPTANNTGFLSAFPVQNGTVSTIGNQNSPTGTNVLFGAVNIPGSPNVLATDASFGAAILTVNDAGTAAVTAITKLADQKATCWATVSDATGTGFVTDVAVNHLVEIELTTGAVVKELDLTNGNPGMIDLQAAGNFIYALSPGNANTTSAVTVFDVSGGKGSAKAIQNFSPAGVSATAQGMAVLV